MFCHISSTHSNLSSFYWYIFCCLLWFFFFTSHRLVMFSSNFSMCDVEMYSAIIFMLSYFTPFTSDIKILLYTVTYLETYLSYFYIFFFFWKQLYLWFIILQYQYLFSRFLFFVTDFLPTSLSCIIIVKLVKGLIV